MKKFLLLIFLILVVGGCSTFFPKRVEFGQDKVQKFPESNAKRKEAERQAVALAAQKAREAERIAAEDQSAAEVPAGEAAELSEAVGRSLGPPSKPWSGEVAALTAKVDKLTADYNSLLEKFRKQNDENVGKKIEDTGFLKIPYFAWVGGAALVVFVLLTLAKVFLSTLSMANPGVAVGLNVAKMGAKGLSNAFSEVIKGGEAFKKRITKDQYSKDEILELFKQSHQIEHSADTQRVIQGLTK